MPVIFLKLGGSLLTDKRNEEAPRHAVIARLAAEIAQAQAELPDLRLILGHGSGSFGHVHGRKHGTRHGVKTAAQWQGFAATADAAARLNRIIVAALLDAGVAAWGIQPSATLRCEDGRIVAGPEATVAAALDKGLLPVIYGDVALDFVRGGTIASTEEIFSWLLSKLRPSRIILAGEVGGIYTADPLVDATAQRIDVVTPGSFAAVQTALGQSYGTDVTGGMVSKVAQALRWIEDAQMPSTVVASESDPAASAARRHSVHNDVSGLRVMICSGIAPDMVRRALVVPNQAEGTWLQATEL